MAEYIDREAAVKAFHNFDAGRAAGTHSTLLTPEEFAEYLYELPAADVAPVVLCDACLHPDGEYNVGKCDYCAQTDSCKHNDNRPQRVDEFRYILDFVKGADLDDLSQYNQLIALWTAFCLHRDLIPDTNFYDILVREVWKEIQKNETNPWKNGPVQLNIYQKYCRDMMQFLV